MQWMGWSKLKNLKVDHVYFLLVCTTRFKEQLLTNPLGKTLFKIFTKSIRQSSPFAYDKEVKTNKKLVIVSPSSQINNCFRSSWEVEEEDSVPKEQRMKNFLTKLQAEKIISI